MFLTIGELSAQSGVRIETIRYYENIKLLPKPDRTSGKQRRYSDNDVKRLSFVRHARELGFEIDQIREILSVSGDHKASCQTVDTIARNHLAAVEERLASLKILRAELMRMLEHGGSGRIADCRVIEVLYDHGKCHAHRRDRSEKKLKKKVA